MILLTCLLRSSTKDCFPFSKSASANTLFHIAVPLCVKVDTFPRCAAAAPTVRHSPLPIRSPPVCPCVRVRQSGLSPLPCRTRARRRKGGAPIVTTSEVGDEAEGGTRQVPVAACKAAACPDRLPWDQCNMLVWACRSFSWAGKVA